MWLSVKLFLLVGFLWKAYQYFRWLTCQPDFTGKVVFISGGSSGIGETLAKKMHSLGAKKVIIAARRESELERVRKEIVEGAQKAGTGTVEKFILDLNQPEDCLKKCKELFDSTPVDIVINCGGCSQRDAFEDLDFSVC